MKYLVKAMNAKPIVLARTVVGARFTRIASPILNDSYGGQLDRPARARTIRMEARRPRPLRLGWEVWLISSLLFTTTFLGSNVWAQDRGAKNTFGVCFGGQFGNGHAFGSTINSRSYQIEGRYSRLVYTTRLLALRYVAEVTPVSSVGDPQADGQRVYIYGIGGSPAGIQINSNHSRRVQPFLTSGGGFLYFNRRLFGETQLNFTAQLGAGVQVFTSRHHSVDFGYKYHHISNANLGLKNPGMDSHVMFVGVSFLR